MSELEFVLKFETGDKSIADEAIALFGTDDVTVSSRMTGGGLEVAAFLKAVLDTVHSALKFFDKNRSKVRNPVINIGKRKIKLEGYGADDAVKVLSAIESLRSNSD